MDAQYRLQSARKHSHSTAALSGVTVRLLCKGARAGERAEEIGIAVVHEPSGGAVRVDSHPADGVDRQRLSTQTAESQGREDLDGFGDVLEGCRPRDSKKTPLSCGTSAAVLPVTSTSPPLASAETRAARLTVAPK